jgi:hypothetical protein
MLADEVMVATATAAAINVWRSMDFSCLLFPERCFRPDAG